MTDNGNQFHLVPLFFARSTKYSRIEILDWNSAFVEETRITRLAFSFLWWGKITIWNRCINSTLTDGVFCSIIRLQPSLLRSELHLKFILFWLDPPSLRLLDMAIMDDEVIGAVISSPPSDNELRKSCWRRLIRYFCPSSQPSSIQSGMRRVADCPNHSNLRGLDTMILPRDMISLRQCNHDRRATWLRSLSGCGNIFQR